MSCTIILTKKNPTVLLLRFVTLSAAECRNVRTPFVKIFFFCPARVICDVTRHVCFIFSPLFDSRCVRTHTEHQHDDDKKDEDEISSCRIQRRLFPRTTTKDSEISCSGASRKGAS